VKMINFNIKKSKINQALILDKLSFFRFLKMGKKIFLFLFILFLILFAYGFLGQKFSQSANQNILGFLMIFFCSYIFSLIKSTFFNSKLKNPKIENDIVRIAENPLDYNLAEFFSFEAGRAVDKAIKSVRSPQITPTHILRFALKDSSQVKFVFNRLLLGLVGFQEVVKEKIREFPVTKNRPAEISDDFEQVILESLKIAAKRSHKKVELGDLLSALAKIDPIFKEFLMENKLKSEDIENLTWWLSNLKQKREKEKRFWSKDNLSKRGSLGRAWTSGYTINLNKYSNDLTEEIGNKNMEFVGHKNELDAIERTLATRGDNNVLLVGQPGTGKRSIVYNLAQRLMLGQSLEEINYKKVVEIDMASLLAQIESVEEVEVVLDEIFQEAVTAGNIILVIDGIHNYIGQPMGLGVIDIAGILSPYLRLQDFRVVGITSYEGLHKNIEKNSTVLSLFEKIEVSEISQRETLCLLENLIPSLEKQYKIFISYPALRKIISLADRYFPSMVFPEKAIDILKEAAVFIVSLREKEKILLPKHINRIVTQKTEIPVGEIESKEKDLLLSLESKVHERIINQEEAVKEVCTALRRARSQISVRKGPMGAFLFLGPTGVGKTETSKALAQIYFGSESKMIRLDMSEFQSVKDISRLIGTEFEQGILTNPVRENPFSLILLDEFEKAHHNILNLFLQVLDEGHITDGVGRKVDFKNSIIIATSNAGYQIILKALKSSEKWEGVRQRIIDYVFEERIFRPELINRFDAVVVFTPLTKENLLDIADLMLKDLKKNLEEKGISFIITQELKEKIVKLGHDPTFGARHMRRVIQDKVENVLASALLAGHLPRGSTCRINPADFSLIVN